MRRALTLVLALAPTPCTAACASLLPYPEQETEICTGGVDEDLDDLVDCDDHVDCDGQCAERTEVTCRNGFDDDLDGLIDAADPRCWPYADIEVRRCESVRGTAVVLEPDDMNWTVSVDGDAELAMDPERGPVLRFGSDTGRFDSRHGLTGAWAGAEISFDAYVGEPSSYLNVFGVVSYAGPTTDIDHESLGAQTWSPSGPSWRTVRARFVQTAVGVEIQASMELPDGTILEDRGPLSPHPDFPAASPLEPEIRGRNAMVGPVSVYRPRWDPCGAAVPGEDLGDSFSWGAVGPDGICLFSSGSLGRRIHRSPDGIEWTHTEPTGLTDEQILRDLEWDGTAGLYRATLLVFPDATSVEHASSPDCVHWTPLGALAPISPSSGARFAWYAIRRDSDGAPVEHEVGWHALVGPAGTPGMSHRSVSATGEPGTFEAAAPVTAPPFWGTPHPTLIGNDRVLSVSIQELDMVTGDTTWVPNAFVEDDADFIPIAGLRIPPTGRRGTAGEVAGATLPELVLDPRPADGTAASGWLFYSGQADGVIVARVSVLPFE